MSKKIKKLISFIKNFIITRKHLNYTLVHRQKQIYNTLDKSTQQLESLLKLQQETMISNAAFLAYTSNHTTESISSWDAFQKKLGGETQPLEFLKVLYFMHDAYIATNTMELLRQGYVNTALNACLCHLHAEKDPFNRQLIYDALKNEVFDTLELTGHEASFYTNQAAYLEMCMIVDRPYDYNYFSVLSKPFYEQALIKWYRQKTGGELNLKNPVTYNDKINWMKLNEADIRKTQYTDKFAVREYVANTIGQQYLVPLINVWDNPNDIDFDKLPEKFVLKATHGSGWNIIVTDKSALNISDAVKRMNWWHGRKLSYCNGLELHYDGIKPRIIAEQYLENSNGELNDYKVWCFDGKAHFIQYLVERKHGLKMAFYDLDWNIQPFTYNYPQIPWNVEKPSNLDELIELAEKLAKDFNHVRVDFYRLNTGEWKFGEMTFTACGGRCEWLPPEYDRIVGNLFNL